MLALLLPITAWAGVSERAYDRAIDLVDRLYLYPDKVDASVLLHASADGLAEELDWLVVERDGNAVHLRHGNGTPIGSVSVANMSTLAEALRSLEGVVLASGFPTGDIDVRLALLKGMTSGLDHYSRVLSGERLERFDIRLKGTLVGVGATVDLQGEELVVTNLVAEGPAEVGGLALGDVLLRIDGVSTVNMPSREAARRIRGTEATDVVLTVRRGEETLQLTLTRAEIVQPNVLHEVLEDGVGYVRITHFSQKTVQNLVEALRELRTADALEKGLVIDLRGNTGGSMKEAARSADQFVTEGLLLRTVGPDGGRVQNLQARMDAEDAGNEPSVPLVMLVDGRTASGSEILAGALLELDRAVLIGSRSYGKGTVQKIYNLDEEARLKLTVAEYMLSNDRRIADGGLVPDASLGTVRLDGRGARFQLFAPSETGVEWDDVLPVVDERAGWRNEARPPEDVALVMARRTVLGAASPSRPDVLASLQTVLAEERAVQEAALIEALAAREIDWTPAEEDGAAPEIDVTVFTETDPLQPDTLIVVAEVTNRGSTPLQQLSLQLSCESMPIWDNLVIPVGRVEPEQASVGRVGVGIRPGVSPRQDEVRLTARASRRPATPVGDAILLAQSSPEPMVSVSARLVGEGSTRTAEVTVHNDSSASLVGLEVYFAFPGDLDVELIDRASRTGLLLGNDEETFSLAVKVGEGAPDVLPLLLNVEAERYGGLVADWPLALPLSGDPVVLKAPRIEAGALPLSAPVGPFTLPLTVTDDRGLAHVVVLANGRKAAWAGGGAVSLKLPAEVSLDAGLNSLVVLATDDQGVEHRERYVVRGEVSAAVDADE